MQQPQQQISLLVDILQDKALKAKEKTIGIGKLLLDKSVTIDELTESAKTQNDVAKGTLIGHRTHF